MIRSEFRTKRKGQEGFGLIETTIAMLVLVIGVLAVLALITEAIKMQVAARDTTEANAQARAVMELISSRPRNLRPAGGSLTTNVTGYNDTVNGGKYIRRWQIEEGGGIPAGSQRITVRVSSPRSGTLLVPVTIRTLMP